MVTRYFVIATLSIFTVFAGCTTKTETSSKPTVVVSILPLKYFVEKIADSTLQVKVLVPPGSSPEMYEPTPNQLVEFSKSDIYFSIGLLDFEKGLEPKLKDGYKTKYINLSNGANLIEGSCTHGDDHEGHNHNHGIDPHIWASTVEGKHIAKVMLDNLMELYPEQKEHFTANYSKFIAEINILDLEIRNILTNSGVKAFLIYHPALGYFARDYGITQMSIEEEGKSPSAKGMLNVINKSKKFGIKAILSQSQFDTHNSQAIAMEIGGVVVKVDPLAENWAQGMLQIANAIAGN